MRRTLLFLPGNSPAMLQNGGDLGADGVILDLEDAVSPGEKDAARILVRNAIAALDFRSCRVIVRINSLDTPYWREDLRAIVPLSPAAVMPTKVSGPEDVQVVRALLRELEEEHGMEAGQVGIIPLLETALGVENAFLIAKADPRVEGLLLGAEDLTADLRCKRTREGGEIAYSRSRLLSAARAAGIDAYDTPFTDVDDLEGLRADTLLAKSLGFTGKAAISPRHVGIINEMFSPSRQEIDYALEVFEAIGEGKRLGKGAVSLRGKMIDAPIVERARQVLEAARELHGLNGGGELE